MSNLAHHSWGKQDRLNDARQVPGITNVLHMNVCIPKEAISDTRESPKHSPQDASRLVCGECVHVATIKTPTRHVWHV